jgi:hypothetical protein
VTTPQSLQGTAAIAELDRPPADDENEIAVRAQARRIVGTLIAYPKSERAASRGRLQFYTRYPLSLPFTPPPRRRLNTDEIFFEPLDTIKRGRGRPCQPSTKLSR